MIALILPTKDSRIMSLCDTLKHKGHLAVYAPDKSVFMSKFHLCDVVVAMGELEPVGIWLWGYTFARQKRVRVFSGVNPCMVSKTISMDKWLESIPTQTELFS